MSVPASGGPGQGPGGGAGARPGRDRDRGRFHFSGPKPGTYRIYVVEPDLAADTLLHRERAGQATA